MINNVVKNNKKVGENNSRDSVVRYFQYIFRDVYFV